MLVNLDQKTGAQLNAPKTSAFSNIQPRKSNLTLHDWLCVVNWYDSHQPISQDETVQHFKNLHDNALIFNQASLSRHLTKKEHEQDQARLMSNPTALSSKHTCIVTWPDVEEAL